MNINQTLAAAALIILGGDGAVAAYGLRYTPVGTAGAGVIVVWDRWEREACEVALIPSYPADCGRPKR